MFDISKLVAVVEATAAAFVPGAVPAIKAAQAVVDLVGELRPLLSGQDAAAVDAALPALLSKMNTDVDQTLKDLRGS